MFSLKNFIKSGLIKAVGNMADYQVILNAAGWLEKRCARRKRSCRDSGSD